MHDRLLCCVSPLVCKTLVVCVGLFVSLPRALKKNNSPTNLRCQCRFQGSPIGRVPDQNRVCFLCTEITYV